MARTLDRIPFNQPYLTGKETAYIEDAVRQKHISGNGPYTKKCQAFFEERFGFKKAILTTSCTDALEMCALLLDIGPGDEVILPSYTFVSTANAFALRGADLVFADSESSHPNVDPKSVEKLITPRTKAIVVVHYAGVACDMGAYRRLCDEHGIFLVEDAAQAIDSKYEDEYLGGIGHLAAFSFHETKNIQCGEGGLLVINDDRFKERAEIIWEKGTNRAAFFRGDVDKYGWVDIGSSFLPSDLLAAFLFAQLENLDRIQNMRLAIWERYEAGLKPLEGKVGLPYRPDFAVNNGHLFYIMCGSLDERQRLIKHLREVGIYAAFHYLQLHDSPYYKEHYAGEPLPNSERFEHCLLRLPFYNEITPQEQQDVIDRVMDFYS